MSRWIGQSIPMLLLLYGVERIEMWDLEKWFIKNDINKKNHLGTLEMLLLQKSQTNSLELMSLIVITIKIRFSYPE